MSHKSGEIYKNRYQADYSFEKESENVYRFTMRETALSHCRFGGLPDQDAMDFSNLGFFDPSGGPFIAIGDIVDHRPIVRIFDEDGTIFIETGEIK